MQSTIDDGELEGKLECPKCFSKVGGYTWQGMRCSCGIWVTPCFSLGKSKVDEVRRLSGVMKPRLGADRLAVAVDGVKSRV